jgi:hypothetical protein
MKTDSGRGVFLARRSLGEGGFLRLLFALFGLVASTAVARAALTTPSNGAIAAKPKGSGRNSQLNRAQIFES